jgi:hypothetical protein
MTDFTYTSVYSSLVSDVCELYHISSAMQALPYKRSHTCQLIRANPYLIAPRVNLNGLIYMQMFGFAFTLEVVRT